MLLDMRQLWANLLLNKENIVVSRYERMTMRAMLNVYADYFPMLEDRGAQRRRMVRSMT